MLEQIFNTNHKLYITEFPDKTVIIFRLLTLEELKKIDILKNYAVLSEDEFNEEIYNLCVLPQYKNIGGLIKAGVPISIGKFIYYKSSTLDFVENEIEILRSQNNMNTFIEEIKNSIMTVFPHYLPKQLNELTRLELLELFVQSENLLVLKTEGKYKPINLKTLRNAPKKSKINFAEEAQELQKLGYK